MAAEPVGVELIRGNDPRIGVRIDELANYGFGGRPSTSVGVVAGPDLAEEFPTLAVREIDLGWGIDSSATVVTADGPRALIEEAAVLVTGSTNWVVTGEGWLAAVYKGGLAAEFEMEALVETISWIMNPDAACEGRDAACPFEGEVAFPPPPPRLVVNADTSSGTAPFDIATIEGAVSIEASSSLIWTEDSRAFSGWSDRPNPWTKQDRGPATVATGFGCFAFMVSEGDPSTTAGRVPVIGLRSCDSVTNQATWKIPAGWRVAGLAVTGNFGQDDYGLVVTADVDDAKGVAVKVPLGERFFDSRANHTLDLASLPALNPDGQRWHQPRRTSTGDLAIVEERPDGWYLVDAALSSGEDLLRTDHPILAHTSDAGHRHIVVVVDQPDGPATWWASDEGATRLIGDATAVAWVGNHPSRFTD